MSNRNRPRITQPKRDGSRPLFLLYETSPQFKTRSRGKMSVTMMTALKRDFGKLAAVEFLDSHSTVAPLDETLALCDSDPPGDRRRKGLAYRVVDLLPLFLFRLKVHRPIRS